MGVWPRSPRRPLRPRTANPFVTIEIKIQCLTIIFHICTRLQQYNVQVQQTETKCLMNWQEKNFERVVKIVPLQQVPHMSHWYKFPVQGSLNVQQKNFPYFPSLPRLPNLCCSLSQKFGCPGVHEPLFSLTWTLRLCEL